MGAEVSFSDEQIAWIVHEAHRAFQMCDPLHPNHVMPAPPWVTMSPWQKETVLTLVRFLRQEKAELDTAEWALLPERVLAEKAHHLWVTRMTLAGWVRGEEKDPQKKTHPNLVGWAELPEYEQAKTVQAVAIVKVHL